MRILAGFLRAPLVVFGLVILLPLGLGRADIVTLDSGAVVRGHVVANSGTSKSVTLRTPSGALLVFDRDSVQQVKLGADPRQGAASTRQSSKRIHLTTAQQAWMPKIRSLVNRLIESDRQQSRTAKARLLEIQDANAIPALNRYLAGTANLEAQRLYVSIVKYIPAPTTAHSLVAFALFNPSPDIREQARKAIGPERADVARSLFIWALRNGDRHVASFAALGISEIGDPNGDAVPYLIDRLVFLEKQPSLDVSVMLTDLWQTSDPVGPYPCWLYGQPMPKDNRPRVVNTHWSADVVSREMKTAPIDNVNSAVLDALVKASDQKYPGFGPHPNDWRRWWATEKKNRDLQKKPDDRVLPKRPAHS